MVKFDFPNDNLDRHDVAGRFSGAFDWVIKDTNATQIIKAKISKAQDKGSFVILSGKINKINAHVHHIQDLILKYNATLNIEGEGPKFERDGELDPDSIRSLLQLLSNDFNLEDKEIHFQP